jgi:hypothetical protein
MAMQESVLSWSWSRSVAQPFRESRIRMSDDVQAPLHFLPVRIRHRLQSIWAGVFEGGCAPPECLCRAVQAEGCRPLQQLDGG